MTANKDDLKTISDEFERDLDALAKKRDQILDKYKGKLSAVQKKRLHEKLNELYG